MLDGSAPCLRRPSWSGCSGSGRGPARRRPPNAQPLHPRQQMSPSALQRRSQRAAAGQMPPARRSGATGGPGDCSPGALTDRLTALRRLPHAPPAACCLRLLAVLFGVVAMGFFAVGGCFSFKSLQAPSSEVSSAVEKKDVEYAWRKGQHRHSGGRGRRCEWEESIPLAVRCVPERGRCIFSARVPMFAELGAKSGIAT